MVHNDFARSWLAVLDEVHELPAIAVTGDLNTEYFHLDGDGTCSPAFGHRDLGDAALNLATARAFRLIAAEDQGVLRIVCELLEIEY